MLLLSFAHPIRICALPDNFLQHPTAHTMCHLPHFTWIFPSNSIHHIPTEIKIGVTKPKRQISIWNLILDIKLAITSQLLNFGILLTFYRPDSLLIFKRTTASL